MNLILASQSQNRQQALSIAKIPFTALPADIDEKSIQDPDIRKRILAIARAKVDKVSKTNSGLILGCDGVNLVDDTVLEKPSDRQEAISMLKLQSGKTCSFLTAYYILNTQTKKTYQGVTESQYKFRNLSQEEIKEYVHTEPVYTWAAAFSPVNSMAIRFVEWMEGSPSQFNFSMPFEKIIPILQQEGVL